MEDIELIRRRFWRLKWHLQVYSIWRIFWEIHRLAILPPPVQFSVRASALCFAALLCLPAEPASMFLAHGFGLIGSTLTQILKRV